jgi:transposase
LCSGGGEKARCGTCGKVYRSYYDRHWRRVRDLSGGGFRVYLELEVRRVCCRHCGGVKQERLDFLADNPRYTRRFALEVGRRCHDASLKSVADALHLDWHTTKELEKEYLREQLRRAGEARPKIIGIDEVSARDSDTGLSSATWCDAGRSGLRDPTAVRPAWSGSISGWGPSGAAG